MSGRGLAWRGRRGRRGTAITGYTSAYTAKVSASFAPQINVNGFASGGANLRKGVGGRAGRQRRHHVRRVRAGGNGINAMTLSNGWNAWRNTTAGSYSYLIYASGYNAARFEAAPNGIVATVCAW